MLLLQNESHHPHAVGLAETCRGDTWAASELYEAGRRKILKHVLEVRSHGVPIPAIGHTLAIEAEKSDLLFASDVDGW